MSFLQPSLGPWLGLKIELTRKETEKPKKNVEIYLIEGLWDTGAFIRK